MSDILADYDIDVNCFNEIYPDLRSDDQSLMYDASSFGNIRKSPNDLSLFHLNIRSLGCKFDEFTAFMNVLGYHFDFICLSETWLTGYNSHAFALDNYKLFSVVRDNKRGGGVSIFIRNRFNCDLLCDHSFYNRHVECIFVKCSLW